MPKLNIKTHVVKEEEVTVEEFLTRVGFPNTKPPYELFDVVKFKRNVGTDATYKDDWQEVTGVLIGMTVSEGNKDRPWVYFVLEAGSAWSSQVSSEHMVGKVE